MISFTEGDRGIPLRAIVKQDGDPVDISSGWTLEGVLISPRGVRTDITPSFDSGAAGDGTDGALVYSGTAQEDCTPGVWLYQFTVSSGFVTLSTTPRAFYVRSNA